MMHHDAAERRRPLWKRALTGLAMVVVTAVTLYLGLAFFVLFVDFGWEPFRSPPTDEEMIAHFHKHRADFEQLVQIYREYRSLPNRGGMVGFDEPPPKIKAIMDRINVSGMEGDWEVWLPPDPYTEEARHEVKASGLLRKAQLGHADGRKFSGVILRYAHQPVRRLEGHWPRVFKGYYYTPFPAKVEKGLLKKPERAEWIVPTLDTYPAKLIPGNCVYRQFEPQWFIRMCEATK
jgi:hypothetical protein